MLGFSPPLLHHDELSEGNIRVMTPLNSGWRSLINAPFGKIQDLIPIVPILVRLAQFKMCPNTLTGNRNLGLNDSFQGTDKIGVGNGSGLGSVNGGFPLGPQRRDRQTHGNAMIRKTIHRGPR